jgi:hypothetical protein
VKIQAPRFFETSALPTGLYGAKTQIIIIIIIFTAVELFWRTQ